MYNERTLPEGGAEKFKEEYKKASDLIYDIVPGCKVIISIPHGTKPNVWHDIQWFNSQEAFNQHIDMTNEELKTKVMNWIGTYDMTHPFTGDVFGDWHDMAQKATAGFGAKFNYLDPSAGFIRQDGFNTGKGSLPLIYYNRIKV